MAELLAGQDGGHDRKGEVTDQGGMFPLAEQFAKEVQLVQGG